MREETVGLRNARLPAQLRTCAHSVFTLIELLVVISIIAILASMLLPAMNKAKYSAKLALCTNNLRQMAIALLTYESDYDRLPYRPHAANGGVDPVPPNLDNDTPWHVRSDYSGGPGPAFDHRPWMLEYSSGADAGFWMDPFVGSYSWGHVTSFPGPNLWSNYAVMAGWQQAGESKGLHRSTNYYAWNGQRFSVLAADVDSVYTGGVVTREGAHPDQLGTLESVHWSVDGDFAGAYRVSQNLPRDSVDSNFVWVDGHVETLRNRTEYDQPRTVKVPRFSHLTGTASHWFWLPPDD